MAVDFKWQDVETFCVDGRRIRFVLSDRQVEWTFDSVNQLAEALRRWSIAKDDALVCFPGSLDGNLNGEVPSRIESYGNAALPG
jgi:hypothetical protein